MCSLLGELHVNIIGCCILIQSHRDETLTVIHAHLLFLLYSNAKRMPIDVQDALKSVCVKHGGLSEEEVGQFMRKLESTKRLQLETWA